MKNAPRRQTTTKPATGKKAAAPYPRFREIDGQHTFKQAVPQAYVDYPARRRHDGQVTYFNFELAKEMGLIPMNHPERLNAELRRAILDTFCLVIINEYDIEHEVRIPANDILPHSYMATRYLQLQHPSKCGHTSGDGRSIWNGMVTHDGVTWDISSCGTGVTRLCPATAQSDRFYKTGSALADYGCGTAAISEGIGAALTSETFFLNGIDTERVLAVIATQQGQSINIRAGRNLFRPSHFFIHLKQGKYDSLEAVTDFYIQRQIDNGDWPAISGRRRRYRFLAEETARTFARIAATFESEYIFCWLDWDGDNILANGGIIDYGSVRQFGLYHREYRFDDQPRMSTTIPEQRKKARYIVQCFAQIRDFLISEKKAPLRQFARDPVLTLFDEVFVEQKRRLLLRRLGFRPDLREELLRHEPELIRAFEKPFRHFERARSSRGPHRVADGISWNAVFCMRDLLRELPGHFAGHPDPIGAKAFLELARSSYASRADRSPTPYRCRMARAFQHSYLRLAEAAAARSGLSMRAMMDELADRSAIINRADRVTGDSLTHATTRLVRNRKYLSADRLQKLVKEFVRRQDLIPPEDRSDEIALAPAALARECRLRGAREKKILDSLMQLVEEYRHSL